MTTTDIWAQWLLHRRHGGDAERMKAILASLYPIRDRVLSHVPLRDGGVLLDVGCGDGLIAFGALANSTSARVIFSDISQNLLDHAASLAKEMRVADRCQFVCAPVEDLSAVPDASVDAVTARSVLIYVDGKGRAFREFHRVLRPGGRLSIFEPINRFSVAEQPNHFCGFDLGPVADVAGKVKAVYRVIQPLETDPMMNFDERDLIAYAEKAGFACVHLELEAEIKPYSEIEDRQMTWDTFLREAFNPKIPSLEEAMATALTADETARLISCMRPLFEARAGTARVASAYLWARK